MNDHLGIIFLILAAIGFVLMVGAWIGDALDERERRDAYRRNHPR